jgi:hypothetical protein
MPYSSSLIMLQALVSDMYQREGRTRPKKMGRRQSKISPRNTTSHQHPLPASLINS